METAAPYEVPAITAITASADLANTAETLTASAPKIALSYPLGAFIESQGGYYAGIIRGEEGQPSHHLFVAKEDASTDDLAWGETGKKIDGASFVNDGRGNTAALIATGKSPAAEACKAYRSGEFDDWYLPAQAELNVAFANCREHFDKVWYWSSTQSSAYYAWLQVFGYGNAYDDHKGFDYRVRAVRRLEI